MSYLVLARKWRPTTFAEVVGQEHVTRTLKNAIERNRVAHALLFTGSRGVGKTSCARILAKALNCERGPTPDPCGTCRWCTDITGGTSVDVFEIDGASNNSVEQIREIRESVKFVSTRGKRKMYIIDEVHMLSTAAFNALLKTLEEPPEHVLFVFATTEPHKIPDTIISRCQRYDFKRIPERKIVDALLRIVATEDLVVEEAALHHIAREAKGGMRDSLSLLDQVIAFSGHEITEARTREVLGVADRAVLHALTRAILDGDGQKALETTEQLFEFGLDLQKFAGEFVKHVRDLMVIRTVEHPERLVDLPESEITALGEQVADVHPARIHRLFAALLKGADEITRSAFPKLALEMTLLRLCHQGATLPLSEVLDGLARLEARLDDPLPPDHPGGPPGGPSGGPPSGRPGGPPGGTASGPSGARPSMPPSGAPTGASPAPGPAALPSPAPATPTVPAHVPPSAHAAPTVPEQPTPDAHAAPVVPEQPSSSVHASPTVPEQPTPSAHAAPVVPEQPSPSAHAAPVVPEQPSPSAHAAPTVPEQPSPSAHAAPVVPEQPAPKAQPAPAAPAAPAARAPAAPPTAAPPARTTVGPVRALASVPWPPPAEMGLTPETVAAALRAARSAPRSARGTAPVSAPAAAEDPAPVQPSVAAQAPATTPAPVAAPSAPAEPPAAPSPSNVVPGPERWHRAEAATPAAATPAAAPALASPVAAPPAPSPAATRPEAPAAPIERLPRPSEHPAGERFAHTLAQLARTDRFLATALEHDARLVDFDDEVLSLVVPESEADLIERARQRLTDVAEAALGHPVRVRIEAAPPGDARLAPETLYARRQRLAEEERQRRREAARRHPGVLCLVEAFGARILDISVGDPHSPPLSSLAAAAGHRD